MTLPKAMQGAFSLNMCGAAVNFAVLLRMFRAAELRWEMHPAQLFSIEAQSNWLENATEVSTEVKLEDVPKELLKATKYTILGVPVTIREDYPEGWIRLYSGNKLVAYMENLAIPAAYGSYPETWEEHVQRENDKAQKIWEADNI